MCHQILSDAFFLDCVASNFKSPVMLIIVPVCNVSFFSGYLQDFSLSPFFGLWLAWTFLISIKYRQDQETISGQWNMSRRVKRHCMICHILSPLPWQVATVLKMFCRSRFCCEDRVDRWLRLTRHKHVPCSRYLLWLFRFEGCLSL